MTDVSATASVVRLSGATIHGGVVEEVVKAMDQAAHGRSSPGTFTDRFTDLTDLKDQMMKGLAQVAAVSLYTIVEFADEKATGRLLVTTAQRQQLVQELERTFGAAKVRKGLVAGLLADETAAAAIHGFLSDPKWRSRD